MACIWHANLDSYGNAIAERDIFVLCSLLADAAPDAVLLSFACCVSSLHELQAVTSIANTIGILEKSISPDGQSCSFLSAACQCAVWQLARSL